MSVVRKKPGPKPKALPSEEEIEQLKSDFDEQVAKRLWHRRYGAMTLQARQELAQDALRVLHRATTSDREKLEVRVRAAGKLLEVLTYVSRKDEEQEKTRMLLEARRPGAQGLTDEQVARHLRNLSPEQLRLLLEQAEGMRPTPPPMPVEVLELGTGSSDGD